MRRATFQETMDISKRIATTEWTETYAKFQSYGTIQGTSMMMEGDRPVIVLYYVEGEFNGPMPADIDGWLVSAEVRPRAVAY